MSSRFVIYFCPIAPSYSTHCMAVSHTEVSGFMSFLISSAFFKRFEGFVFHHWTVFLKRVCWFECVKIVTTVGSLMELPVLAHNRELFHTGYTLINLCSDQPNINPTSAAMCQVPPKWHIVIGFWKLEGKALTGQVGAKCYLVQHWREMMPLVRNWLGSRKLLADCGVVNWRESVLLVRFASVAGRSLLR